MLVSSMAVTMCAPQTPLRMDGVCAALPDLKQLSRYLDKNHVLFVLSILDRISLLKIRSSDSGLLPA